MRFVLSVSKGSVNQCLCAKPEKRGFQRKRPFLDDQRERNRKISGGKIRWRKKGNQGIKKGIKMCYLHVPTPHNKCNPYILQICINKKKKNEKRSADCCGIWVEESVHRRVCRRKGLPTGPECSQPSPHCLVYSISVP